MKRYYDRRAPEYDVTSYEAFPAGDVHRLEALVAGLPAAHVLDVGCGTGWLTRLLRGRVVALDQSPAMLERAAARVPGAVLVRADVPPLPFPDGTFDRVFSSGLYSHLEPRDVRRAFRAEAARVAGELVLVEQAWQDGLPREAWETRVLADGSRWPVFKRYFTPEGLAAELGGEVLLTSPTFVAVVARRR